jgi:hypothetical protein
LIFLSSVHVRLRGREFAGALIVGEYIVVLFHVKHAQDIAHST